ncbi:MAG TPA: hypothetical protein VMC42_02545 [Methanoregulaceae archaeon]|nr:hypothetical protein [Methanoregulaceae archaeon]
MDDIISYTVIGVIMFGIGIVGGYIITGKYYSGRFVKVAKECEAAETIVPLIAELERES